MVQAKNRKGMRMGIGLSYFNRCFMGVVLCLPVGVCAAHAASEPAFGAEAYRAAHAEVASGNVYDGAVHLIELLRSVPGDAVRLADQMVGPAQLLGFCIASLMDWPDRTRLLTEVLKPEDAFPLFRRWRNAPRRLLALAVTPPAREARARDEPARAIRTPSSGRRRTEQQAVQDTWTIASFCGSRAYRSPSRRTRGPWRSSTR